MASVPILHADADSFFASVVMRRRPDLQSRPMAVTVHVFIASANYPARCHGVRGGMLTSEALARCPELQLVDVPRGEVEDVGEALLDLFAELADAVEPGSIEEAFLGVGQCSWEEAVDIGVEVRRRARVDLGIPVSVGVGRTKLFAKLGSRAAKPDGLLVIRGEEERRMRSELPIADVWGIGRATRKRLAELDVARLSDLDAIPDDRLRRVCGTAMMRRLRSIRLGTDDAVVRSESDRTTLSSEAATSGYERRDATVTEMLEACISRIVRRAAKAGLVADGLKVDLFPAGEGRVVSLSARRPSADAGAAEWLTVAEELARDAELPALRGLRVSLTGLVRAEWITEPLF